MSEPDVCVWNIGVNGHGQPIKLTRYKNAGKTLYRIDRDAANQRDDCAWIGGLTAQNLKDIAEVTKP